MTDHILYELECGEVTFGDYDDVFKLCSRCLKHGKREWIIRVITSEWKVFCTQCKRWTRWCGIDKQFAQELARKHWRAHPQHNPQIQKRRRQLAIMAELDLRKKVAEMEWMWYNGRVIPGKSKVQELPDEPPF